ncbi:MAG: response regulator transcription factor [Planctomycetota bacterium]|jgi:FixJ family two-component response regulator
MTDRGTVYIVDDDDAVRDSIVGLVETMGLAVRSYESAEEFLAAFEKTGPACLVLDVRMPGMSGTDLLDRLETRYMPMAVIFVTGHSGDVTVTRHAGAITVDSLEKPFRPGDLQQRILSALEADQSFERLSISRKAV